MRKAHLLKLLRLFTSLLFTGSVLLYTATSNAQQAGAKPSETISDKAATPHVAAQLVASVAAVQPGTEIYLGVHQEIIPHWHTYWKNPGDSGLATTIDWTLPEGATASDILWPIPSRSGLDGITNYGYSDQVTLLSKIKIPAGLTPGESFTAQAKVDWLVCNEECIPQQVKLALTLPVVASGASQGGGSSFIDQALAQLPVTSPWSVKLTATAGGYQLYFGLPAEQVKQVKSIWFYPAEWGRLAQNANQPHQLEKDGLSLSLPIGEAPLATGEPLHGVLVVNVATPAGETATGFELSLIAAAAATPTNDSPVGFVAALGLALLGGLVLNLMPCVFPVLSLKALSLVAHAQHHPREIRLQGWVYTLGVLVSFGLLAGLLVILKASGAQIGWGFQFQSPIFVLAMAWLMFVVGLNLSGVFVIGGSIAGVGSDLANKPGYTGSFFTGVLATIVATPCTAPFMAAALGYALTQPSFKLIAIFLSLGIGLALPYLLLANWPGLQRWLPRPGAWMDYTKQLLAFPMYAATAWLVWVLAQQAGSNAVILALTGLVALGFAAWLYQITRYRQRESLGTFASLAVVLVTLSLGFIGLDESKQDVVADTQQHRNYEPYSAQRLDELLAQGKPVFLNFTASWCISCLVNERVALSSEPVVQAFQKNGITYLKGDWTKRDPQITQVLSRFSRSGVPLYVFYPAGNKAPPIELPQVLTPDTVLSSITTTNKTASAF
jgi:thiol:disulfide interchange protein